MRRREFITFLGGAASLCTLRSFAQSTDRVRLVGWLSPSLLARADEVIE